MYVCVWLCVCAVVHTRKGVAYIKSGCTLSMLLEMDVQAA